MVWVALQYTLPGRFFSWDFLDFYYLGLVPVLYGLSGMVKLPPPKLPKLELKNEALKV